MFNLSCIKYSSNEICENNLIKYLHDKDVEQGNTTYNKENEISKPLQHQVMKIYMTLKLNTMHMKHVFFIMKGILEEHGKKRITHNISKTR